MWLRFGTHGQSLGLLKLNVLPENLAGHSGLENSSSGFQTAYHIFPLVIGVAALTTILLLGSFLWGYVSRKNKKEQEKSSPFNDLYLHAGHKPNTVVFTPPEFTKPSPSNIFTFTDYDNNAYFDTLVFDPQHDYAQVLAEARLHAAVTRVSPVVNSPVSNGSKKSQMTRSSSARQHDAFLEDLEAMFPHDREGKSSVSWKKLLFWKRSKKRSVFDIDMNGGGVHSSCNTPLHHAFKSPKMRATVAPTSSASNGVNKKPVSKRSGSGPVYSDGIPYLPNRNGRPVSGPLSGSVTPSRDGLYESAYIPLKKPGSSKISSGPLYVT